MSILSSRKFVHRRKYNKNIIVKPMASLLRLESKIFWNKLLNLILLYGFCIYFNIFLECLYIFRHDFKTCSSSYPWSETRKTHFTKWFIHFKRSFDVYRIKMRFFLLFDHIFFFFYRSYEKYYIISMILIMYSLQIHEYIICILIIL